jgi:hypothetical protein
LNLTFLQSLTPTEYTDCSLWQATKRIKQIKKPPPLRASQGKLARSNVGKEHAFAEHLTNVVQPHPSEYEHVEEETLLQLLENSTNSNHQSTVSKRDRFKKSSKSPKKSSG